jgi:phthalate 4,5-dioxygenase
VDAGRRAQRLVSKTLEYANYLQTIEGGVDTAHISFLHNNNLADRKSLSRRDLAPRLEVERTDYGFRYAGIRDAGEDGTYVRVYQFVMPFHQMRPAQAANAGFSDTVPQVRGHMWVPIDDHSTWVYNWMYAADPARPLTPQIIGDYEKSSGRGPAQDVGNIRTSTRENNWGLDREVQRTKTFTGIPGLNTQDLAVQESMGPIVPRWREHLGTTDIAVITLRQIFLDAARNLEQGIEPPGLDPTTYRDVRSADLVIPNGTRWQDEAKDALIARA